MKKLFIVLSLVAGTVANAKGQAPRFSAFSVGDNLYVTVLGDNCNHMHGTLQVALTCRNDRLTKNLALVCMAELSVVSTAMGCQNNQIVPRVMTISLKESHVAPEAQKMELSYGGEQILIQLNQINRE